MIRLLIVDDEVLEIESIKASVDFAEIGIDELFEANNIRQAKGILSNSKIDLLLCDIEMPQGTGLELLKWVRENTPVTKCIFLTCHADFSYARQAISLGSLDYLLKPARSEELTQVLQKALQKIREEDKTQENTQFSTLWLEHQPLVVERFWLDILNHKTPSTLEAFKRAAASIGFPGLEEIRVIPVLIRIQSWSEPLSQRYEKLMEFALRNVAEETILKQKNNGIVIDLGQQTMLTLLYRDSERAPDTTQVEADCAEFVRNCNLHLKCDLCCYLGILTYLNDLVSIVSQLRDNDRNNIAIYNQVLLLNFKPSGLPLLFMPDMAIWMAMLESGSQQKLVAEISSFLLSTINASDLNASFLYHFQQDFTQAIYSYLKQKGIQARLLFGDSQSVELYNQATRNIEAMQSWIEFVVDRIISYIDEVQKSQTVIEKVKAFIALNLEKDITCDEIAGQVFLNPIYLTRIFKKKTGLPISEYLLQERLNLAKDLLIKTTLPVSTIAGQVGYSNFSHFSRMFRKYTGLAPLEFRHQAGKKADQP